MYRLLGDDYDSGYQLLDCLVILYVFCHMKIFFQNQRFRVIVNSWDTDEAWNLVNPFYTGNPTKSLLLHSVKTQMKYYRLQHFIRACTVW